jgi:hypothetical protein
MRPVCVQGAWVKGGVFTDDNIDGTVYAGEIAYGSACLGVATRTNGTTRFVECDDRGKYHGRKLDCTAGGDTVYELYRQGSAHPNQRAVLRADGTCEYNGKDCSADFAPFVALQAEVLPIKARPH